MKDKLPWIHNAKYDLSFFFLPSAISILIVLFLDFWNKLPKSDNNWNWLLLVVLVDVAHVWATLFRTYLNKEALSRFKKYLVFYPLISFLFLSTLYLYSPFLFWRVMAYLALFHFMRQQVGFLAIYLRNYSPQSFHRRISTIYIWLCMLVPVLDWHTRKREFSWFIKGDFFFLDMNIVEFLWISFAILSIVYILFELINYKKSKLLANLHILLTFLIWAGGISYLNNDFAFSITNIIHHGFPYLALIWISSLYQTNYQTLFPRIKFNSQGSLFKRVLIFIMVIFLLAIIEEILWDKFLWHEREGFLFFSDYVDIANPLLAFLVGFLATPQVTHYLLDGVIWKRENKLEEFKF